MSGADYTVQLYAQDPKTLEAHAVPIRAISLPTEPYLDETTFDPASGDYSFLANADPSLKLLYCENVRSGEVHRSVLPGPPVGLEADPATGLLYGCWLKEGMRDAPSVWSLDPHSGHTSLIARLAPPLLREGYGIHRLRLLFEAQAHAFDASTGTYYCYLVPATLRWWDGQEVPQRSILCAVKVRTGQVRYVRAERLIGKTTFDPASGQIVGIGAGGRLVDGSAVLVQDPSTGATQITFDIGDNFPYGNYSR